MSDGLSAPYSKGEPEAQQLGIVLRTSLIAIGFFPVAIVCFLKDFFFFFFFFFLYEIAISVSIRRRVHYGVFSQDMTHGDVVFSVMEA